MNHNLAFFSVVASSPNLSTFFTVQRYEKMWNAKNKKRSFFETAKKKETRSLLHNFVFFVVFIQYPTKFSGAGFFLVNREKTRVYPKNKV